jgi:hypothetical protein
MPRQNQLADELRQRAQRAILTNALMRWESATLLALTIIGGTIAGLLALVGLVSGLWPVGILAGGLIAWVAVFTSSLSDEEDNARVVAMALREHFDPKRLRSVKLRAQVDQALNYRDMLTKTIEASRDGVLRDRLSRTIESVDQWIEAIYHIANRLDAFEANTTIQQDMRSVPKAIETYRSRLKLETDEAVVASLEDTLAIKERQGQQLSDLQGTMERASYRLESTLAMLGTIYAQLQGIDLRAAEKGRTEEIRSDINEQVLQLQDLGEAMDEVYEPRRLAAG